MAAHSLDLRELRVARRVAVRSHGELEEVDHRLQRIRDALVNAADEPIVDEEANALRAPDGLNRLRLDFLVPSG